MYLDFKDIRKIQQTLTMSENVTEMTQNKAEYPTMMQNVADSLFASLYKFRHYGYSATFRDILRHSAT